MEQLFNNYSYVIFGIILLSLFMKKEIDNDYKKIIISYILMFLLEVFNILDIKYLICIFLLCSFLYFEILINDEFKNKILRNVLYKVIEWIYLLLFRYHFLTYIIVIILASINNFVLLLLAIVLLFIAIIKISTYEFDIYNYTEMYNRLIETADFANFEKFAGDKENIITYLEDRSFYDRMNDYTYLCWDFLKYRLNRINDIVVKKNKGKEYLKHHRIRDIVIYIIKQCIYQFKDSKSSFKLLWSGHSTIEMQLFRTIAVKDGYNNKYKRKFAEYFYTQLFFKGLKRYLKTKYQTVSNLRFKNYILYCYISIAPVFLNGKVYNNITKLFKKRVNNMTNEELVIGVLGFSNKFKYGLKQNIFTKRFGNYYKYFNLSKSKMDLVLKYIKEEC